jgi:hypothetical protein
MICRKKRKNRKETERSRYDPSVLFFRLFSFLPALPVLVAAEGRSKLAMTFRMSDAIPRDGYHSVRRDVIARSTATKQSQPRGLRWARYSANPRDSK